MAGRMRRAGEVESGEGLVGIFIGELNMAIASHSGNSRPVATIPDDLFLLESCCSPLPVFPKHFLCARHLFRSQMDHMSVTSLRLFLANPRAIYQTLARYGSVPFPACLSWYVLSHRPFASSPSL